MSQIIVSYRNHTALLDRLVERLREKFGQEKIIFGTEKLLSPSPTEDPLLTIEQKVEKAGIVIAILDSAWLEGDWIRDRENADRLTIATALRDDIRLIPVLLDDAELPTSGELPSDLSRLSRRVPLTIGENTFYDDAHDLIESLERYMNPEAAPGYIARKPKPDYTASATYTSPRSGDTHTNSANSYTTQVNPNNPLFIRALTYPFTDESWISKVGIGAIAALIPIVGAIVLLGYGLRMAKWIRNNGEGLPEWDDFGGDLVRGFVAAMGSILQALIWLIPTIILFSIIVALGPTTTTIIEDEVVTVPSGFSLLIGLLIVIVTAFFFLIINITALANYSQTEQFSAFFELGTLMKEATSHFGRNLALILNIMVLQLAAGILGLIGLNLCLIPGLFINAVGAMGYGYVIAEWSSILNKNQGGTSDFDGKPKRGLDNF